MYEVTNPGPEICGHRWYGPRADVTDAYAWHVCDLPPDHVAQLLAVMPEEVVARLNLPVDHHCVCGARSDG